MLQNIAWFFPAFPILHFFLRFKSKGNEHISDAYRIAKEKNVGVMFCANHISELDPILILFGTGPLSRAYPMFYVIFTLSVYRDVALFGWRAFLYGELFFKCWGAHPLIAGQKDYSVALAPHVPILMNGNSLTMFPEGRISKTGEQSEARGGAGYLALKTSAVVVPVKISGIAGMTQSDFWFRRRSVTVCYGASQQFMHADGSGKIEPELCKSVSRQILETINTLS